MSTYSKRDIRAADMLALILVGLGVVFVVLALWRFVAPPAVGRPPRVPRHGPGLWIGATVFLALGSALNLKVRLLNRSGRRESEPGDDEPGDDLGPPGGGEMKEG